MLMRTEDHGGGYMCSGVQVVKVCGRVLGRSWQDSVLVGRLVL